MNKDDILIVVVLSQGAGKAREKLNENRMLLICLHLIE